MRQVWVFGYGSLIWRPGFEYESSMVGHIEGFTRVFYQGNDKHRGTPQRLGRVATLLENDKSHVWGRAFLIEFDKSRFSSAESPLDYLNNRESTEGGYASLTTTFHPRDPLREPVEALVYIALPSNNLYIGAKPYPTMAREIIQSHGDCGSNVDYVLNVADFMRDEVGDVDDEHLFMLEMHILSELENQSEFGDNFKAALRENSEAHCSSGKSCPSLKDKESISREEDEDFASNVLARKLRCVDI